jgi:hypothetical protein
MILGKMNHKKINTPEIASEITIEFRVEFVMILAIK